MTTKALGLTEKDKARAIELINLSKSGQELTPEEHKELADLHTLVKAKAKTRKPKTEKKKGGGNTMAHLSAYDKARKQLKADGEKTDQSTTKQTLMAKLIRSSNPKYKALGEGIKAEIQAKAEKKSKPKKATAKKKATKKTTKAKVRRPRKTVTETSAPEQAAA